MRTSVALLALTLTSLAPQLAHATKTKTIDHSNIVGDSAYATWEYQTGNIGTFVSVSTDQSSPLGNSPSTPSFLSVSIAQYYIDSGIVIVAGSGFIENVSLTIDHALGSASIQIPSMVFEDDYNATVFNISLNLTWTATGESTTQKSNDHYSYPGYRSNSRFKGEFRDAIATGSIFGNNTEFTPSPSSSGQLQHNSFGNVTIQITTP